MQRGRDDDEALQPHADVDEHRRDEKPERTGAALLEPHQLRRESVADPERGVHVLVRSQRAILEHVDLEDVAGVEAVEPLHRVCVRDDQSRREHHLAHVLEVLGGDEVFELEKLSRGDRQREHHRESGEDGAGDEVGREKRRVPSGQLRDREVERHDRVHGKNERRRKAGQQEVRVLVAIPVLRGAAPSEGERAVDALHPQLRRAIAQRREIGNQSDIPEQRGDRRVGRDREHVPHQRAAELRPQAHRVRVREHPPVVPGTSGVQRGIQARRRDREQRHRFRESIDRRAPLLTQEEQDRGDQRAGVADADPPDEVDDVHAPSDRMVDAEDADAFSDQEGDGEGEETDEAEGDEEPEEPAERRLAAQDDRGNVIGDGGEVVSRLDRRSRDEALRDAQLLRGGAELVDGGGVFGGHR